MTTVKNKRELKELINQRIVRYGYNCNLNDIDVSKIADMSQLFQDSKFNGDISKWNVSRVYNMDYMFYRSQFNGDISDWKVRLTHAEEMFCESPLEGKEPSWYKEK